MPDVKGAVDAKFLLDLVENANDLIQSVDMAGRLLYVNRAWRETLGYTEDEIPGLNLWDVIHPDSLNHCKGHFGQVCETGSLNHLEAAFRTKDGRKILLEGSVNCRYVQGKPASTRGIFRNITEMREMESRMQLRSQLLDYAGDAITLRDKTGALLYCNRAAYQRLGYTYEEYFELGVRNITDAANSAKVDRRISEILKKGELLLESVRVAKDGTVLPVEIQARVLGIGREKVILSVEHDITDRKKVEDELRLKNRQLEDANQAKSRFVASMSHELRTPLNAIIGLSGLILDGTLGEVNGELKESIADILGSGQRLLNLINDVLDMSKVEAGKVDITIVDVDLRAVLENAVHVVKPLADKSRQTLTLTLPPKLPPVRADAARLEQVMVNLLSNAIKFTPSGGKIEVRSTLDQGWCQVSVSDDGVGIKKRDLDHIFDPYTQAETLPDKKNEGTGLGLQISKQFVELMGGAIWAESIFGKGSKFYFALPISQKSA